MFSTVPDFKAWFPDIEEFPRPDWKAIRAWIGQNVSVDRLEDAWQAITREWLQRICERLGKSYVVTESQSFHLVSELDEAKQIDLLSFLERSRTRILRQLGDIPLPKSHGKHVILRFSEDEDYYRYIAYFHPEGEYAGSAGNFLRRGYRHIAYPHRDIPGSDRATLVHELTHNLLVGFPLPAWLNEALAMAFERYPRVCQPAPHPRAGGRTSRLLEPANHSGILGWPFFFTGGRSETLLQPGWRSPQPHCHGIAATAGAIPGFCSARRPQRCRPVCRAGISRDRPERPGRDLPRPRRMDTKSELTRRKFEIRLSKPDTNSNL